MGEEARPRMERPRRALYWWVTARREPERWVLELGDWPGFPAETRKLHWTVGSRGSVREEVLTICAQRRIPTQALRMKWISKEEGEAL